MINKVAKYIERQGKIKAKNESQTSLSKYYELESGMMLRVSDHLKSGENRKLLSIIPVDDNFVIQYQRYVIVIKTYNKLKEFIRNFVITNSVLKVRPVQEVSVTEIAVEKPQLKIIPVYKPVEGLSEQEQTLIDKFRLLNSKYTESAMSQIKNLLRMTKVNCKTVKGTEINL